MKCHKCLNEIDNDSLFCEHCGTKVASEQNPGHDYQNSSESTKKSKTEIVSEKPQKDELDISVNHDKQASKFVKVSAIVGLSLVVLWAFIGRMVVRKLIYTDILTYSMPLVFLCMFIGHHLMSVVDSGGKLHYRFSKQDRTLGQYVFVISSVCIILYCMFLYFFGYRPFYFITY